MALFVHLFMFNGLKPVVTKFGEPMALKKNQHQHENLIPILSVIQPIFFKTDPSLELTGSVNIVFE
jgi:hypothetical protein